MLIWNWLRSFPEYCILNSHHVFNRFPQNRRLRSFAEEVLRGLAQHHARSLRHRLQLQLHPVRHPPRQLLAPHPLLRWWRPPLAGGHLRLDHLLRVVLVLGPGESHHHLFVSLTDLISSCCWRRDVAVGDSPVCSSDSRVSLSASSFPLNFSLEGIIINMFVDLCAWPTGCLVPGDCPARPGGQESCQRQGRSPAGRLPQVPPHVAHRLPGHDRACSLSR